MLLGIGGFATAGKDAFADFLVEVDSRWHKTYMSYALERALLTLDPWIPRSGTIQNNSEWVRYSDLHEEVGYAKSKENYEVRHLLQLLGTEVGRKMFGEDVWVDKMLDLASKHEFCVVTGIRYQNELDAIEEVGGVTVWVQRPGVGAINTHSSDNTLTKDDFQYTIQNNGTLDALKVEAAGFSSMITDENY